MKNFSMLFLIGISIGISSCATDILSLEDAPFKLKTEHYHFPINVKLYDYKSGNEIERKEQKDVGQESANYSHRKWPVHALLDVQQLFLVQICFDTKENEAAEAKMAEAKAALWALASPRRRC